MPITFFAERQTGMLTARINSDVALIQKAVGSTIPTAIREGLSIIVLASLVISIDYQLAFIAFVGFPIVIGPLASLGKRMKKLTKKNQHAIGNVSSHLYESLGGVRVVKAFGTEDYETARFSIHNEKIAKYSMKDIVIRALSTPLMETIGAVCFAITIGYATKRIGAGTLEPEQFLTFFAAVVMLYKPIKALNGVNLNIQQSIVAGERVFEVLDMEEEKGYGEGGKELKGIDSKIEFKDVSFSYGDKKVIDNLSLNVKRGTVTAIVGSSGAGKTTFVNLLPRFYDVDEGSIMIDGTDIREFSLKSLRSSIAVISQQVVLFDDTVANNISYGTDEASIEKVEEAAKASNAHRFISEMPNGYNTVIGEGGVRLSGGERQRLSIARAFVKDAPILIMDEATSSLDTESEREVQKGFDNLMKDRTVFVIAHRLSTVVNAHNIIVMKDGKIEEQGTHEELLKKEGEYSGLYNMQFKGGQAQ